MRKTKRLANKPSKKIDDKNSFFKNVILPFVLVFTVALSLPLLIKGFISSKKQKNNHKPIIVNSKTVSSDKIVESLETVASLYLDPTMLVKIIDNDPSEIILIDTRSQAEFKKNHIKNSINLSLSQINEKTKDFRNRKVVLYGQTAHDSVPVAFATRLIKNGIETRILAIGWNEFRHFRNLWLPESSWSNFDYNKYLSE